MSYADCANGVLATLSTLTTWFGATPAVSLADLSILRVGIPKGAAVLIPGGVGSLVDVPAASRTWDVVVGLFYRTNDTPAAVAAAFVAMRDDVIHLIDETPGLGTTAAAAGVWNVTTKSIGDPEPYALIQNQPPAFVMQWLRFTVYQQVQL